MQLHSLIKWLSAEVLCWRQSVEYAFISPSLCSRSDTNRGVMERNCGW